MINHFYGYLYVVKTKNSPAKEGAVLFGKGVEKNTTPVFTLTYPQWVYSSTDINPYFILILYSFSVKGLRAIIRKKTVAAA